MALLPQPLAAQDRGADAELEALIPDTALDNPEQWAAPQNEAAPAQAGELDPASPLAENSGIALPWPDEALALPTLVTLEPDPDMAEVLAAEAAEPLVLQREGEESRISEGLVLVYPANEATFPVRRKFEARFRALSALQVFRGEGAESPAQVAVRARTDRDLLQRLLRDFGYYDADIVQTLGEGTGSASVRFDLLPGARYRFGVIDLGALAATGEDFPALRETFAIQPGDPLLGDRIVSSRDALKRELGESGYAFARIGEPDLLIDHRREEGDLALPVTPGGRYRIAGVTSNLEQFLPGRHLQRIARFDPGDLYRESTVEDYRRAILATGLAASVAVTPRESAPGEVMLDTALTKAPLRTIAGAVGYDSGDGPRLEVSWEHRNLFPPEGLLRLRGVLGTKEQLAGVTLRKNNFRGRDQVLTLDLFADNVNRDAFEARTIAFSATFEKLTTLIFQKPWVWSVGSEFLATSEREGDVNGIASPRRSYYIAALPLRAAYDASDDLLDPTRGFRASLRISPELSVRQGRTSSYARIQADASAYLRAGRKVVLAARARVGSIAGAAIAEIAPSRRFYAGGGGSVRGFGYQQIGPRDTLGDPSGGRSLSEFSIEARVKTGLFGGSLSIVPFIDAGAVDEGARPMLRDVRYGAGIGIRYDTNFGPIRVDLGTPLNRRAGESPIGVYVALGQAF